MELGYTTRLVDRSVAGAPDSPTGPAARPSTHEQTASGGTAPSAPETRLLVRRQWRHLTAQVLAEPSCVGPVMIASVPQTQLILQLSGTLDLSLCTDDGRSRQYRTLPGTLYLTAANRPDYELTWLNVSAEPVRVLEIYLDDEFLAQTAAADAGLDAARLELHDGTDLDNPLLRQLGHALARELTRPESQNELYADTAARMLAMQLARGHSTVQPREKTRLSVLPARTLRRLADHVRARLAGPITLDELAAVAGLSPYHFARVFRRSVGQSPNAYVIAQRLAHAAHLLRQRSLSIPQVAERVGYQDVRHFARLFRRQVGCSPADYVRQRTR